MNVHFFTRWITQLSRKVILYTKTRFQGHERKKINVVNNINECECERIYYIRECSEHCDFPTIYMIYRK